MPEPDIPPTVAGIILPLGSIPPVMETTRNYRIQASEKEEGIFMYIPPFVIGQYVSFLFAINSDIWIEPQTGLVYMKPTGKTIGNSNSKADYEDNRLKNLFVNLHSNPELQLLDSDDQPVSKTGSLQDWFSNRKLKLPYSVDSQRFIYSGCLEF